jgi:steroid 5-alpha reductase family enzyme
MKALKITLLLVAVLLLTVSGVQSKEPVQDEPTYKEYSPKDLLAVDRKKLKTESHG